MAKRAEKAWEGLIWQDKGRMSGEPCIFGTRIRVQDLFDWLAGGRSLDDFLAAFPQVKREQAVGVLRLAEQDLLKSIEVA